MDCLRGLSPRGRGKPGRYIRCYKEWRSIPAWAGETRWAAAPHHIHKVYPRVGGGNLDTITTLMRRVGLSPRGRGKLRGLSIEPRRAGSIPAWAGETCRREKWRVRDEVYPRVGGGNMLTRPAHPAHDGLSPRGRGKPHPESQATINSRSIPAWAGETIGLTADLPPKRVYPRVGGGNRECRRDGVAGGGLSPRGRGKQFGVTASRIGQGSIPAWAGETAGRHGRGWGWQVYPRVGGGNNPSVGSIKTAGGLSPRGRGKPALHPVVAAYARSIPAWAGETRHVLAAFVYARVYPRVGGGNDDILHMRKLQSGLSPRGRGKLLWRCQPFFMQRSIPAWAGETHRPSALVATTAVYPRVGGGNYVVASAVAALNGLSPRGRGKLPAKSSLWARRGSIPAWAGETAT